MNGKIVEEDTKNNLMKKYKASGIDDLLIRIFLNENDQRDYVSTYYY